MKIVHDDAHTELLTENEALRRALARSEDDCLEAEQLLEERNDEVRAQRLALARMEARALRAELHTSQTAS